MADEEDKCESISARNPDMFEEKEGIGHLFIGHKPNCQCNLCRLDLKLEELKGLTGQIEIKLAKCVVENENIHTTLEVSLSSAMLVMKCELIEAERLRDKYHGVLGSVNKACERRDRVIERLETLLNDATDSPDCLNFQGDDVCIFCEACLDEEEHTPTCISKVSQIYLKNERHFKG